MDLKEVQDIVKNVMRDDPPEKRYYHFVQGFGDNMGIVGHFWAQILTDAAEDVFSAGLRMPTNYVEGTAISIYAVILTGGGTGNIKYDFELEHGKDGEVWAGNNIIQSNQVKAVGTASVIWLSPSLNSDLDISNDSYMAPKFVRKAGDAADTLNSNCYGAGFMLSYRGRV